ncbi:MAG: nucleotidyltransferase domain-containing protein [Anaerolineales bacterium]|nr:nucleotidyltransferase domain-containing protein [Anaerolineales bacterium]
MGNTIDFSELARHFDGPGVRAVVLMGSMARGDAGPYSDIDLVRFKAEDVELEPQSGSRMHADRLVVVSDVTPAEVEAWFTEPKAAVDVIAGLRIANALIDREGYFAAIQARARAFTWDAAMQAKANHYVSREMVGWIEEVHKGLEGLRRAADYGRLLNARFGLTWGLSKLMAVYQGVLLTGDNAHFEQINRAAGENSRWVRLRRIAFGVDAVAGVPPSLRQQVVAGLRLYAESAHIWADALGESDRPLVERAVMEIERALQVAEFGEC